MERIKYIDKDEFVEKGKKIYNRLKSKLERDYRGKVVAIEIESGEYIIGDDELDAAIKAKNKFPDKIIDFIRIGYKAVHKLRKVKN